VLFVEDSEEGGPWGIRRDGNNPTGEMINKQHIEIEGGF
jgi:hypothetical protein